MNFTVVCLYRVDPSKHVTKRFAYIWVKLPIVSGYGSLKNVFSTNYLEFSPNFWSHQNLQGKNCSLSILNLYTLHFLQSMLLILGTYVWTLPHFEHEVESYWNHKVICTLPFFDNKYDFRMRTYCWTTPPPLNQDLALFKKWVWATCYIFDKPKTATAIAK